MKSVDVLWIKLRRTSTGILASGGSLIDKGPLNITFGIYETKIESIGMSAPYNRGSSIST